MKTDKKLVLFEKYYKSTKPNEVSKAISLFVAKDADGLTKYLNEHMDTPEEMFNKLLEKLKGKSVYKTLKKIEEGKATDYDKLKALFSLGTHAVIECEQGNQTYAMLYEVLYNKLGEVIFNI